MSESVDVRMAKAVEAFGRDLGGFRTGRASASLVERVVVEHYGAATPLNQLAGISVPESTLLVVQPWDPSTIPAVEKALNAAQLGMTPAVDGGVIRLRVPAMTEERRKDLVKQMGKRAEEARIETCRAAYGYGNSFFSYQHKELTEKREAVFAAYMVAAELTPW